MAQHGGSSQLRDFFLIAEGKWNSCSRASLGGAVRCPRFLRGLECTAPFVVAVFASALRFEAATSLSFPSSLPSRCPANRYIKDKDEDLGSRLNLQPKQVRSALTDLMQEGLVMQEDMEDETYSSRLSTYWYIDLRHAVNVIRLRLHEMQVILNERQQAKMAQQVRGCGSAGAVAAAERTPRVPCVMTKRRCRKIRPFLRCCLDNRPFDS